MAEPLTPDGWQAVVQRDPSAFAGPAIPNGWMVVNDEIKPKAELKAYNGSWRDKLANFLLGDEKRSPTADRAVEQVLGTRGLGPTGGMNLADLTPLGAEGASQHFESGHPGLGMLDAMAVIPGAKVGTQALKQAMISAADRAAATSAARETQATLRARAVSPETAESLPLARVYDQASGEYRLAPQAPSDIKARATANDAEERALILKQSEEMTPQAAARAAQGGAPSVVGNSALPNASRWMINPHGEVESLNAIPHDQLANWRTLYDDAVPHTKYLSPEQMAASRAMWGNPTGSLWDKAWMPTTAPQGVKDAVKQMVDNPGIKWGDILTGLAEKMKANGAASSEIQKQLPSMAAQVAHNLGLREASMVPQQQQLSFGFAQ